MAGPGEIKSRFVLKFEEEGAEKLQKKLDGLNQSMQGAGIGGMQGGGGGRSSQAQGRLVRQIAGMSRHIHDASKSLIALNRAAGQVEKALSRLSGTAGGVRGGGVLGGGGGRIGGGGSAAAPAAASPEVGAKPRGAPGSFTQGALQGVGFGPYLQRGPGMFRQAAGMLLGGGLRRVGGRLTRMGKAGLAMPFRGAAGLAEGLASIPFGGLVTGGLQVGLGAAKDAIADESAWTQLGGGIALTEGEKKLKTQAEARAKRARDKVMKRPLKADRDWAARVIKDENGYLMRIGTHKTRNADGTLTSYGRSESDKFRVKAAAAGMPSDLAAQREAQEQARKEEADKAAKKAYGGPIGAMARFRADANAYTLMNRTQAAQFAGQLGVSTLDGSFQAAQSSGQLRQAMQLNTLGVGPEATAGFIRGARQGGLSGKMDMAKVWSEAIKSGFDRSEVTSLMGQITQGQQQFLSTGMPINQDSLVRMSGAVTGALGPGGRSAAFAGQLSSGMQNLARSGPQSVGGMLAFRDLGGYGSRGGGLSGYWEAKKSLSSGKFGAEGLSRFINRAGQGPAGYLALEKWFSDIGVNVSPEEIERLSKKAQRGELNNRDVAKLRKRYRSKNLSDSGETSRGLVHSKGSSGQRGQRDIQNERVGIGKDLVESAQSLERSTLDIAKGFAEMSKTINGVTGAIEDISSYVPVLASKLQEIIDGVLALLPSGD